MEYLQCEAPVRYVCWFRFTPVDHDFPETLGNHGDYSGFSWILMDVDGFFHMLRRIIPTDFHILRPQLDSVRLGFT